MNKPDPHVSLHQCLFGYQDGHRLLSSSLRLEGDTESLLLLLSDLAPGLRLPANGGYWTGIPLPGIKSYALMRTWPAPEMPRPGCVWTHALIIPFAEIARFPDLSILAEYVVRPRIENGFAQYSATILSNTQSNGLGIAHEWTASDAVDTYKIIRALYSDQGAGTIVAAPGAVDHIVFSVWSQQWPQLRRSFSFRTAANQHVSATNLNRFDLTVMFGSDSAPSRADTLSGSDWEDTCASDLFHPHSTDFRRFLWRYGSDVRLGQKRFKFLSNIYLATRCELLSGKNLHDVMSSVTGVLRSMDDGKVLKQDLVGRNQYALLPPADPIDLLDFFVSNPGASEMPIPAENIFGAIHHCWKDRSEEILVIAERVAKQETELGNRLLLPQLAKTLDASTFFAFTTERPYLRNKLAILNPMLLDSEDLINVPMNELLRLIRDLPQDEAIARRILPRLFSVDDIDLATGVAEQFREVGIIMVIEAIDKFFAEGASAVANPWVRILYNDADMVLKSGLIERMRTTSALFFVASVLENAKALVMQAGPLIWANGLKHARDDLRGKDRQNFLLFLLESALQRPTRGCEPLFEMAFDRIHSDLEHSRLSWPQANRLMQYLPILGFFSNWDTCQRLRMGVANAYVEYGLSPESFRRLTVRGEIYTKLVDLAKATKVGISFLNAVPGLKTVQRLT